MSGIEKLLEVMASLRDPREGCPWDQQQDFSSIAPYTVEEAYEVADAIARDDLVGLKDELGDLLFQVVFHARMAEEVGCFDFDDVAADIAEKMIRRHPHVFGDEEQRKSGPSEGSWEEIKATERAAGTDSSALAGLALALPALRRAQKLGKRAGNVGFDWPDRQGVRAKIREELDELEAAVGTRSTADIHEEFGDLLFAVVNLARHLDVDAEQALASANQKFERRFRDMERAIADTGKPLREHALESLEMAWRAAKKRVG
ncbi:MAG: nucleoside triphosphate pyrophosphohydrolase [Gammaproteobacteria bacterium]|nr:nucleoside triphosphate pyrophosphohydrolase [Gammaproteobacteria bacterium]MDH3374029.1 nucleoside triphosphate pyrophosphohydrolase [Gammaproteobacteria bacterium]MDH3408187.1 nucleoside triphosphate pyrophosphohydrolase [Gammaproteobacteria bacterium]MDH3554119.1 nucleoside triphosphate pyrophosphohydrolase [Gammaproteobacteria bacterium]